MQINSLGKNIRKNPESVDIGFATKSKILEFKKQAGDFLAQLLHHLEKSPLKYAVVRTAVCFNPVYMRNLTY